jgi:hypothetical protein
MATDEEFEITGRIVEVRLGNPHGELTLAVNSETWVVEVEQPCATSATGSPKSCFKRAESSPCTVTAPPKRESAW